MKSSQVVRAHNWVAGNRRDVVREAPARLHRRAPPRSRIDKQYAAPPAVQMYKCV